MKRGRSDANDRPAKKRKPSPKKKTTKRSSSMVLKPELKAVDVSAIAQTIGTGGAAAGHVILMNGLHLGTDRCERIGRKIQIQSAYVRIQLYPLAAASPENILVMVVQDKDVEAALPTLQDVCQTTNNARGVVSNVTSFTNLNTTQRFKILRRALIPFRSGSIAVANQQQGTEDCLDWEWYIPLNVVTQYNAGDAATVADIENNALYVMYFTDSAAGGSVINITTRVRYFD